MQIIFLRHGPAGSKADWHGPDAERPLTDDGRGVVGLVADGLARAGVAVDALLTSPLVRSRQTAEIAAAALGCADRLADDERLAHDFDRKRLAAIVADHPGARTLMLVGHEPDFSATIAQLTTPSPMPNFFPTVADVVGLGSMHIGMHVGQIQVLRRKLGKPILF